MTDPIKAELNNIKAQIEELKMLLEEATRDFEKETLEIDRLIKKLQEHEASAPQLDGIRDLKRKRDEDDTAGEFSFCAIFSS